LIAEVHDFHTVIRLRVLRGRPLGENNEISLYLVGKHPIFGVSLPVFRMIRFMNQEDSIRDLELLAVRFLKTYSRYPHRGI
jgi:hypothetical protein